MTRRLLFAAALLAGVAFALAGWWLLAVAVQVLPAYLAGWWGRARVDADTIRSLRADDDRKDAELTALRDERDTWWPRSGRWADDDRLMPDNGAGYRTTAAARDDSSAAPAPRAAGIPSTSR